LSILLTDPTSTLYVFRYKDDPDDYPEESALGQCAEKCTLELPLGTYSVRIVTSDGARSYAELELRSSRWIAATPAHRVRRDLGFVAGAAGTVSVLLGSAMLGKLICDKTCTPTARDATGAIALGLGIPLMAVGWSLYAIHRKASIEDRIVTQGASQRAWMIGADRVPRGIILGTTLAF